MTSRYPGLYEHKSGYFWIRRRVPTALVATLGRTLVQETLGTKDRRLAEALFLERMGEITRAWSALAGPCPALPARRRMALAGEFYRSIVKAHEDDPGPPGRWKAEAAKLGALARPPVGRIGNCHGSVVSEEMVAFLHGRGVDMPGAAYTALCRSFFEAKIAAYLALERMSGGDFSPDPAAVRFPEYVADAAAVPLLARPAPKPTLPRLTVDDHWGEYVAALGLSRGTQKRWRPLLLSLADRVPDNDLGRVTTKDVRDWTRALALPDAQGRVRSPTTISDAYLAAARSFFGWACAHKDLPTNPCDGIKVVRPKVDKTEVEENGFTKDEALLILSETLREPDPRLSPFMAAARRWVPWICAYTGARVNEVTQLRGVDVTEASVKGRRVWVMRITPEAGTVKDRKPRDVPLHEHVVEQGFVDYVRSRKGGRLFYDEARGGTAHNPTYRKVGDKLAAWVRAIGIDRDVAPNHGWRHAFSTAARDVLMREETRRAILGHAPSDVDEEYGHHKIEAKVRQIRRMRRFDVSQPTDPRKPTAAAKARSEARMATARRSRLKALGVAPVMPEATAKEPSDAVPTGPLLPETVDRDAPAPKVESEDAVLASAMFFGPRSLARGSSSEA